MTPCQACGGLITNPRRRAACSPECRAELGRRRARAWYEENHARVDVQERRAAASRRHVERVKADPERYAARLQQTAEWRASNPDQVRQQLRSWRSANPDKVREKLHRRRARQLDAYVAPIDREQLWETSGGLCGVCGSPMDRALTWPHQMSVTLDHIVALADGGLHEPENAQLAHMVCNARKGAKVQRAYGYLT